MILAQIYLCVVKPCALALLMDTNWRYFSPIRCNSFTLQVWLQKYWEYTQACWLSGDLMPRVTSIRCTSACQHRGHLVHFPNRLSWCKALHRTINNQFKIYVYSRAVKSARAFHNPQLNLGILPRSESITTLYTYVETELEWHYVTFETSHMGLCLVLDVIPWESLCRHMAAMPLQWRYLPSEAGPVLGQGVFGQIILVLHSLTGLRPWSAVAHISLNYLCPIDHKYKNQTWHILKHSLPIIFHFQCFYNLKQNYFLKKI